MAHKINGGLPELPDVGGGWQIIFAAVDPTTGAAVAGVTISGAVITADPSFGDEAGPDFPDAGPPMFTVESLNGPGGSV